MLTRNHCDELCLLVDPLWKLSLGEREIILVRTGLRAIFPDFIKRFIMNWEQVWTIGRMSQLIFIEMGLSDDHLFALLLAERIMGV